MQKRKERRGERKRQTYINENEQKYKKLIRIQITSRKHAQKKANSIDRKESERERLGVVSEFDMSGIFKNNHELRIFLSLTFSIILRMKNKGIEGR
jgi:hypothetical protein